MFGESSRISMVDGGTQLDWRNAKRGGFGGMEGEMLSIWQKWMRQNRCDLAVVVFLFWSFGLHKVLCSCILMFQYNCHKISPGGRNGAKIEYWQEDCLLLLQ